MVWAELFSRWSSVPFSLLSRISIVSGLLNLFPAARRKRIGEVLDELGFTLWWWLMGQLVTMASVGILIGIGLTCLGVPLAGTLAPHRGHPFIHPEPRTLSLRHTRRDARAHHQPDDGRLGLSCSTFGVQIMEANVITPLVQRKAISLPPAFCFGLGIGDGPLARVVRGWHLPRQFVPSFWYW